MTDIPVAVATDGGTHYDRYTCSCCNSPFPLQLAQVMSTDSHMTSHVYLVKALLLQEDTSRAEQVSLAPLLALLPGCSTASDGELEGKPGNEASSPASLVSLLKTCEQGYPPPMTKISSQASP